MQQNPQGYNSGMKIHCPVRCQLHPDSRRKHPQWHGAAGACLFVWDHKVGKPKGEYAFGARHADRTLAARPSAGSATHANRHDRFKRNNQRKMTKTRLQKAHQVEINAALNILAFGSKSTGHGGGGIARSVKHREAEKSGKACPASSSL